MQNPEEGNNRMGWLYDVIAEQAVKQELSPDAHRWLRKRMAQSDLATRDPNIRKRSPFWLECLPEDDNRLWWHGFQKYKGGDRFPLSLSEVLSEYEGRNSFRSFLSDNWDESVEREAEKREWIMDVIEDIGDWESMAMAKHFLQSWDAAGKTGMNPDDISHFHARWQTVALGTNLQAENDDFTEFLNEWEHGYEEGGTEKSPEEVREFLETWFGEEDVLESARKLFQTHVAPRFSASGLPLFACRNELAKSLGLELLDPSATPLDGDHVLVEGIGVTLNSAGDEEESTIPAIVIRRVPDFQVTPKALELWSRGDLFGKLQEECEDFLRPCYDNFFHQHPLMFELMVKSLKGADFLEDDDEDEEDDDGDEKGNDRSERSGREEKELLKDLEEDGKRKKKAAKENIKKRKLDVEAHLKPDWFQRPDGWTFHGAYDAQTGQKLRNRKPMAERLERFRSLRIRCTRHNKAGGKSMYAVVRVDSKTCRTADSGKGDYFMNYYCKSCRTKAQKVVIYDPKCTKCGKEGSLIKEWMMFELIPTTQFVEVSIWKTEKDEFVAGNRIPVVDILYPKVITSDEGADQNGAVEYEEEDDDPDDGIFKQLLDKTGKPCDWSIKFKAVPSEEEADRNTDPIFDPKRMILDRPSDYIAYDQIFEDKEQNSALADKIRNKVSKKKRRWKFDGFDLDLTYVTPRIIAMGYPSVGTEGMYRNHMKDVQKFFAKRHPSAFKLYNLCSERKYDPVHFDGSVARYPFDDHNPSPFELIERFCEDVRQFLAVHPQNVVAIHCKAGKGRTGTVIAAYLCYIRHSMNAMDALFYFGNMRTKNKKGVTIPSQMRYVTYFDKYCRMKTNRQISPGQVTLFVESVIMYTLPKLDNGEVGFTIRFQYSDQKYKNRVTPEVIEGSEPNGADGKIIWDFRTRPIPVREDVLFIVKGNKKLFQCWFNTRWTPLTMTTDGTRRPNLVFDKMQLDKAVKDCKKHRKLHAGVKFEIIFSRSREILARKMQELVEKDLRNVE